MPSSTIQKRSDPQALYLRQIRDRKDRAAVFCEGEKLVGELFLSNWKAQALYVTSSLEPTAKRLLQENNQPSIPIKILSDSVMEFCSDVSTPPGIIAIATPPKTFCIVEDLISNSLLLVAHGVQLPQNVGALLRTCEASGVAAMYVSGPSADVFGPKSLRGSSGSAFRVPVGRFETLGETLNHLRGFGVRCFGATQNGVKAYDAVNWRSGVALVMGTEGRGFSKEELDLFDQTIKIPMQGKVESLNVGTAAAICLFEAARQRRHGS